MAVHHEQALTMAGLAPSRGSAAVVAIANSILVGQAEEDGMLRGWLRSWDAPTVDDSPMAWMPAAARSSMSMQNMPMHTMSTTARTAMPGMASPGEMRRLWAGRGKAFDVLFLQLMIRHHLGGIEMAAYAVANAHLAEVRDAARAMAAAQIEELGKMRALLKADGGKQLPPP
jgi:uncharacterized protein (DUF305 family)